MALQASKKTAPSRIRARNRLHIHDLPASAKNEGKVHEDVLLLLY